MEECIFCKIAKGEIPSYKVYEDENFLAFLDINPLNPGHTLVIPKKHYRWVWDVDDAGELFEVAKKIANKIKKMSNTDLVVCGSVGKDVHHAHIHLIPRFDGDAHEGKWIDIKSIKKLPKEEMEEIAEKIREA